MFTTRELKKLSSLIDPDANADDVLEKDEKEAVQKTTNLNRIRDQLIIPVHKKDTKTITVLKVFTDKVEFSNFVSGIVHSLRPMYEIRLGCSFIMLQGINPSYVYAIPARPVNQGHRIISDENSETELIKFSQSLSYKDLLDHAFQQRNIQNPLEKSGYRPEKLICLTAWITKTVNQ